MVLVLTIALTACCMSVAATDRSQAWAEVDKAVNNGLPKTAIEKLQPIIDDALAEGKLGEAARAMSKRIVLEGNIQGNKAEEKIYRLEAVIEKSDPKLKPILKTILARWYWHYYQQNNWRFLNRSATAALNEKDFTTWDLPKLFGKIGGLFDEIMVDEKSLQAVSISSFDDFLERGNQPVEYRPTLFDFIAFQALEFYTSGEQAAAQPQEAFDPEASSPILGDAKEFTAWAPQTPDTDSPKFKALSIYQRLLKYHLQDANRDALLDDDLLRLSWARSIAVGEDAGERYIAQLKKYSEDNRDSPFSALAMAYQAKELIVQGKRKDAYELAVKGNSIYPDSHGGQECKAIMTQLEAKTLTVQCERVVGKPLPELKIDYTNIDKLHFRLVAKDWKEVLEKGYYDPDRLDWNERGIICQATPAHEWQVDLPGTPDFNARSEKIPFPKTEPGFYYLIASWKSDFSESGNAVRISGVWVSSLALINRTRMDKIEGIVVDNETGEPIPDAKIRAYENHYNNSQRCQVWTERETVKTNANGLFKFTSSNRSLMAVVQARGETLFDFQMLNAYAPGKPSPYDQVFFFTDRAIYRPGQTIQFKGIVIRVDQDADRYEIIPNRSVKVIFRDPNYQEIGTAQLQSNEHGSFAGTFTAPAGRLTGVMTLEAQSPSGSAQIRVEEYKRPKFKVTMEPPSEGGRLNDTVKLKGEAMAYTGAAIDGAKVKFRVVREIRMPWWWCWWGEPRNETSQEITHGTIKTDSKGGFEVAFKAMPDKSIPESDQPTFVYTVSADVTDSAGETRSVSQSVRLGYVALDLNLSAPEWLEADTPIALSITTSTLDGKGIPAEGSFLIHALKEPVSPVRPRIISDPSPDASNPASWELGKVVAEENFTTEAGGNTKKSLSLKAGAYRLIAKSRDRFGKEVTSQLNLTVIDSKSAKFSVRIPHFFKTKSSTVEVGENFSAIWGTGYDKGRAFVEIEHRNNLLKAYWTQPEDTQHLIEIPVDEKMRGGFTLRLTQVRENRCYFQNIWVNVPWSNKQLKISFEHFTSKLQPGQNDSWSLRIQGPGAEMKAVEMAAALYDASLDAFAPHYWLQNFQFFRHDGSSCAQHFANFGRRLDSVWENWNPGYGVSSRDYYRFPYEITANFSGYGHIRSKSRKMDMADSIMPQMSRGMAETQDKSEEASDMDGGGAPMEKEAAAPSSGPALASGKQALSRNAGGAKPGPDLSKVAARSNLNETAFFFPQLVVENDGLVKMSFTMPEALTTWKFLAFAHGKECESGGITAETITQKDLMVQPNPPRFLREGDMLTFTAKVTNLSDTPQKGQIRLSLTDPATDKSRDTDFGISSPDQAFEIPAKESRSFGWALKVPDGPGILKYKVVAATDNLSDGEEAMLPILTRRILVHEAMPLPIRGPAKKKFAFQKLLDSKKSDTLVSQGLTIQVTSNPAWYAVQALPYLMEFPHECAEQVFNRLYANSLARFIALSDKKIRKVFDTWKAEEAVGGKALVSNLEKNEELKNVLLIETPWVIQAKSETEAKHRVGLLFDDNKMQSELENAQRKLEAMQSGDGSWPWFPGGPANSFITLYITTGFGRLKHLGVTLDQGMALKAVAHLDQWIDQVYRDILRYGNRDHNNLSSTIALYFYGRSFFLKEKPIPGSAKEAVDYFLDQGAKHWLSLDCRLSQGHLALGLLRFGDAVTAKKIGASVKERSVTDEEMGRFWRDTEISWWWYRAPIETQSVMVELFDEVMNDPEAMEECKIWLLKQKQTQDWKTSKATADAIYALLLKGANLLASDKLVQVALGGVEVKPEKVEAGTGFYEKRFAGPEVKPEMGDITMSKEDSGVAWGGIHWQYLEDMSKITPHETNLKLKKTLFVKKDSPKGPQISPVSGKLEVGDLLVVRVELRVDRDMEYVHLKDGRGSGLEPVDVLSGYRYQDGLAYYQSTKDTASHFFIDYLPKGTYIFEYNLRVQHKGRYQTGMAEIQCMYAPEFGSHSESIVLEVE